MSEQQNDVMEFSKLAKRVFTENPTEKDLKEARSLLRKNPEVWKVCCSRISQMTFDENIKRAWPKCLQLLVESEYREMKREFNYEKSNPLEKLLIDQILINWANVLHMQEVYQQKLISSHTMDQGVYWNKQLDSSQNRYLKSIEMLAKVKKLNCHIALQVNIAANGGKQINVNPSC